MAVLKCSTCTAPLDVEGTETFVTCKYCKSRNRVMKTVQGPQLVKASSRAVGKLVLILVLAFGVLPILATAVVMIVIGAGAAVVATRMPAPAAVPAPTPRLPPAPAPARDPRLTPSQLATHDGEGGWIDVDAPGMVGTFATFDPSANLAWAHSIARAWTTDARIGSIYLDAVRPDGTIDLSSRHDWQADYRFFSPTRRDALRRMREVSEQEMITELRVMVGESRVQVLLDARSPSRLDDPDEPALETTCTTAQVQQLMRDRGLPPRPHYDMALTHVGRVAWWRWTAHDSTFRGSSPQVDATTCALHR